MAWVSETRTVEGRVGVRVNPAGEEGVEQGPHLVGHVAEVNRPEGGRNVARVVQLPESGPISDMELFVALHLSP